MTITDWFRDLPPASMTDSGLKMLIYLIIVFFILSAIAVAISTKVYKKKDSPTLLDMDLETDRPVPSDIPPAERIAILKIEKAKFLGAQRALSDAHKKKEIGESIFTRLSVRYTSDVKKIEGEIEKTAREAEVSQLEQELKKMQGDYLSKIKGEEKIETPAAIPTTAPPAPPTKPVKEKKVKKEKKKKKEAIAPPTPPMPTSAAAAPPSPPMPPSIGKIPPPTAIPSPPMPTAPKSGTGTPSIPAPSMPTPKPPAPAITPSSTPEGGEGDLFAKSTSIAALRKEMLKELDRLKKFMSEQQ
jgi:DNA polymerase III gamma/tau subunit